jgi:cytochrome bd ubiquinol oxidase subunit II
MELDLPVIWAVLIGTAVFLYVLLDGFDLGVGILFPMATPAERNAMVASIAPVWDGNETWLILGGGGLFAAFPLAYAILMPAMYLPVGLMLIALIFRGVAFEFRHNAGPSGRGRAFWTAAFALGSLIAALSQGLILGGYIQGVTVEGRAFAGGALDWLTPYSVIVAIGLAAGYALLGACWLIFKTEGELQVKARAWAQLCFVAVGIALLTVSYATLFVDPRVTARWGVSLAGVDWGVFPSVAAIPVVGAICLVLGFRSAGSGGEISPFLYAMGVFVSGFAGLALSVFPNIIPFDVTIWQAAAAPNSQMLMLVAALIMLPVVLGYTAYVYWIFRGKSRVEAGHGYH